MNTYTWTIDEALVLVRKIEEICPAAKCHVALTGGVLYKDGPRKDLDLMFYRVRQAKKIDMEILFALLDVLDIRIVKGRGWLYKATYGEKEIDIFFPEEQAKVKGIPDFTNEGDYYNIHRAAHQPSPATSGAYLYRGHCAFTILCASLGRALPDSFFSRAPLIDCGRNCAEKNRLQEKSSLGVAS